MEGGGEGERPRGGGREGGEETDRETEIQRDIETECAVSVQSSVN